MLTSSPHFCSPLQAHASSFFSTSPHPRPRLRGWGGTSISNSASLKHFQLRKSKTGCLTVSSHLILWSLLILETSAPSFQLFRLGAFLGLSPSSSHASMGTACQSSRARARGMPTPTSWTSASLFPHLPRLFLGLLHSSLIFLSASIQIILNTQQRSLFCFVFPPTSCLFLDSTVEWLPIECAQSLQCLAPCHLPDVFLHLSFSEPVTRTFRLWVQRAIYAPTPPPGRHFLLLATALSLTPLRQLLKCHFLSEAFLAQHFPCPSSPSVLGFIFLHGFYGAEPDYVVRLLAHSPLAPRGRPYLFCFFCSLLLHFLAPRRVLSSQLRPVKICCTCFPGCMHLSHNYLIDPYCWIRFASVLFKNFCFCVHEGNWSIKSPLLTWVLSLLSKEFEKYFLFIYFS